MKILIFGATGMVGQGVLRECLQAPDVELVTTVGRSTIGTRDPKVREVIHRDLEHLQPIEAELAGFDACFFSLGASAVGLTEAEYARVNLVLPVAVAETLSRINPGMTFAYVSGTGTDSSEQGRIMWARVKGRTENALLRLPLNAYMFRPALIQPRDRIQSRTPAYRNFYSLSKPILPLLHWAFPSQIIDTRELGKAMLQVARKGNAKRVLEMKDIRAVLKPVLKS
jgi:uncharacterized protein YbjT (DUF2867 family)